MCQCNGGNGTHSHAAAVAQFHHSCIDVCIKHLRQFGAILEDSGGLLVVHPGIVEHEPHVSTELGG